MPYPAHVVEVLIASPSDVLAERQALREAIWAWNDEHAADRQVVLLPIGWETHSRPELGAHPQALIDHQVADRADVLVGVFWTRLGTPTPDAASGTVHEIERFKDAGKPVLLYFSDKPVAPSSVQSGQLEAVREFRTTAEGWGLLGSFDTVDGLVQQARPALLRLVRERFDLPTAVVPRATAGAPRLLAEAIREQRPKVDSKGRYRESTHHYLQIVNAGDAPARGISLAWADGPQAGPQLLHNADEGISDLPVGASVRYAVLVHFGSQLSATLRMTWKDDAGKEYSELQTVRF